MTDSLVAVQHQSGHPPLRPTGLPPRTPDALAERLGVAATPAVTAPVTGVTHDSRAVRPGDLYVALPGARTHGADFAVGAAASGAVAALTDEAGAERCRAAGLGTYVVADPRGALGGLAAWVYGEPATRLTTVGITGTNGKTTTGYLVETGMRAAGHTTGLVGTIEIRVADQRLPAVRTTPEATDLQALLAVMVESGVTAVAMEVSSHALVLGRVDGVTYDVAVFTNLSPDHLDFHADMADYYAAKASLFTPERSRAGVVDVDDEYGRRLAREATVPVVTVSVEGRDADWQVGDLGMGADGSRFTLTGPGGRSVSASTRLVGRHNVANAALAVVALHVAGTDLEQAARGVAGCLGVPGRMERVGARSPVAFVDYAHTPDALERLLASGRSLLEPGGRLLVVVGCGGDRDPHKRPAMGRIAARDADVAILTSDNPRSEDPAVILAAMKQGADEVDGARVDVVEDRRSAIARAVSLAGPGDVVVVAGKGHEQGQEVAGVVHPFDDRVVLAEALQVVSR